MGVAPPRKGSAGLVDGVAVVSGATETVGGKLEGDKEDAGTTTSAAFKVPRSGTRVEEGVRAVGVEVGGPVAEPVRAVAVIGAPVVDVVGGLVLVEEGEEEEEVGEEEEEGEGVVQVEEGEEREEREERSVDALGASSESVVTGINYSFYR